MLSRFDDYPIHATPEPLAHLGSSDRNFFDRFFFHGYTNDGALFFGASLGVYPNRGIMDAAFSVVHDSAQHSLHASRRLGGDRTETRVGPLGVEIVNPMQELRVWVDANPFELEAQLRFRACTPAIEEPRFVRRIERRVWMDMTRATQFGRWEGRIRLKGDELEIHPNNTLGCRDRSWGIRPIGEPEAGAPTPPPQFFWLWAPIHFEKFCSHFEINEDAAGRPWHQNGNWVPVSSEGSRDPLDAASTEVMQRVSHAIDWEPRTRRARAARLTLYPFEGEPRVIELEPILTFQMLGLGYLNPHWGHGMWKGELAVDGESWRLAECNPLDPRHLHVQQLCRARMEGRSGLGVLEQLVIGEHAPSGFRSLLDPAP